MVLVILLNVECGIGYFAERELLEGEKKRAGL